MGFSFKSSRHGDYVRVESEPVRTSLDDGTSSVDRLLQKEMPALEYTTSRPWWRRYAPLILVHVFLFVTYSALLFYFTSNIRDLSRHGPSLVASPANEAIFYKERAIPLEPNLGDKPFAARPSPELDANWDELVKYANIEVETEYMRHLGREEIGVRLPDKEDRFLGTLNVYHQLHCVRRLHQWMYQDSYFGNQTEQQKETNRLHSEHCIEYLRQAIMCHSDVGLITFEWSPSYSIPIVNPTTQTCVNWEALQEWAGERAVEGMQKSGYLIHPQTSSAHFNASGSYDPRIASYSAGKGRYDPRPASYSAENELYDPRPASYAKKLPYDPKPASYAEEALYDPKPASYSKNLPYDPKPASYAEEASYDPKPASYAEKAPYDPRPTSYAEKTPYDQRPASYNVKGSYDPKIASYSAEKSSYDPHVAKYGSGGGSPDTVPSGSGGE